MKTLSRSGPFVALSLFLVLTLSPPAAAQEPDILIMVDGLPLDAKAVKVKDEVFVPAWILENYARTKVNWMRPANILEIVTAPPAGALAPPQEGKLSLRIGFYLEQEGFVVGKNTRLFLLNTDPKEFRFPDGKGPADRAHEGAADRIGPCSQAMREYLLLPPTDRFSPRGWNIVARMPKEEIVRLSAAVDRYELLYKGLYYDLVTNLVLAKEAEVNTSGVIDESLKGLRIERIPVREDGSAEVRLSAGLYYVFGRLLYRNRQIVWDLPVAVRGGETVFELSNRNAALMQ